MVNERVTKSSTALVEWSGIQGKLIIVQEKLQIGARAAVAFVTILQDNQGSQ